MSVPRAQWAEMDKLSDADKVVLDKLIADGTLVSYAYPNVLHQEGDPAHDTWFSALSGNILKALETMHKQPTLAGAPKLIATT